MIELSLIRSLNEYRKSLISQRIFLQFGLDYSY
jgi:hypothetical protein